MKKRRKPLNLFNVIMLVALIGVVSYFNFYIAPGVQIVTGPTSTPTRDPESFVTEAQQLYSDGKLKQAADAYQQAIQARPNDSASYVELAHIQIYIEQYKAAQVSAENALLLNPNNAEAHAIRGWALEWQNDYPNSQASIQRALSLDPNNADAHAYNAVLLVDEYQNNTGPLDALDQASSESKTAINLDAGSLDAHYARGYVLEVTQNYEDAIREFQAAASINANIPVIQLELGLNYRALGVYDKAVESLTRANALNPTDPQANYAISRTYAQIGEYAKAEQYAQQAANTAPSDPNLHGNLGIMYYHDIKWPEALKELTLAVKGGQTDNGVAVQPLDINASSRSHEYFFTYGLVLARLNHCGDALPIAQQIMAQIPSDDTAVYNANQVISICSQNSGTPIVAQTTQGTPGGTSVPASTTAPSVPPATTATP